MTEFQWHWHLNLLTSSKDDDAVYLNRLRQECEFAKEYVLRWQHGHPGHLTMMALGRMIISSELEQLSNDVEAILFLNTVEEEGTPFRLRIRDSVLEERLDDYIGDMEEELGRWSLSMIRELARDVWEAMYDGE